MTSKTIPIKARGTEIVHGMVKKMVRGVQKMGEIRASLCSEKIGHPKQGYRNRVTYFSTLSEKSGESRVLCTKRGVQKLCTKWLRFACMGRQVHGN